MKEHLNTIILAVAIILAVVIYCFGTKYQVVGAGKGVAFQVNRITGSTRFLAGLNTYPMKEGAVRNPSGPSAKNPFEDLPEKSRRNDNQ